MRNILPVYLISLFLTACSVGMALKGSESPDLGAIKIGASRGEIELHLGSPVSTRVNDTGLTEATYRYEIGN